MSPTNSDADEWSKVKEWSGSVNTSEGDYADGEVVNGKESAGSAGTSEKAAEVCRNGVCDWRLKNLRMFLSHTSRGT
jgi:hypothetical protein